MHNTIQVIDALSKIDKFHANKHHKVLTYSEIKAELKELMKELEVYKKSNMRLV